MSAARSPLGLLVRTWPKLSETFILEEVLGLERRGIDLRLYALNEPSDGVAHEAVARVRAPLWRVPAAENLEQRAALLTQRLRHDGVSHLHVHFISDTADVGARAARQAGLPFSISAHAKDIYLSDAADLRRKLRNAAFTVTCTEANRRVLADIAPDAPVHLMYHGIDGAVFHPARRSGLGVQATPLLLAVGRLREKKGFDTLIEACRLLHARGRPVRCEIVGYGEARGALARGLDAAGLSRHVRLVGKLTREQVIRRYADAAVFVQPSRIAADGDRDGIPNVLLEAMAMGLPVVATRVSGIPELVRDGHNGLLVEPDAPDILSEAIERVLLQPAEAAAFGRAARATVLEHFDNDRNLDVLGRLLAPAHVCGTACAAAH